MKSVSEPRAERSEVLVRRGAKRLLPASESRSSTAVPCCRRRCLGRRRGMAVERSDEGAERLGRKELAPLTRPSRSSSARATDWHPSGGPAAHVRRTSNGAPRSEGQGGSAHDRSAHDRSAHDQAHHGALRQRIPPSADAASTLTRRRPTLTFSYSGWLRCWIVVGGGSPEGWLWLAPRRRRPPAERLRRVARSANALTALAQRDPSSVHDRLRGTVLLCRCGSRSAGCRSLRGNDHGRQTRTAARRSR